ncbi:MAG: hypothetical protein HY738_00315 [Bacteroidia bacterium]|nr:hypothetical protein [Bacteroidia bacterium]
MKNLLILLALIAFIGTSTGVSYAFTDNVKTTVVKPDGKKCEKCGKENCDGKCAAAGHKCDGNCKSKCKHKCTGAQSQGHSCQGKTDGTHKCSNGSTTGQGHKCCPQGQMPCCKNKATTTTETEKK